jgi:hypothetical protein
MVVVWDQGAPDLRILCRLHHGQSISHRSVETLVPQYFIEPVYLGSLAPHHETRAHTMLLRYDLVVLGVMSANRLWMGFSALPFTSSTPSSSAGGRKSFSRVSEMTKPAHAIFVTLTPG